MVSVAAAVVSIWMGDIAAPLTNVTMPRFEVCLWTCDGGGEVVVAGADLDDCGVVAVDLDDRRGVRCR